MHAIDEDRDLELALLRFLGDPVELMVVAV
jgi:hypothetical protein